MSGVFGLATSFARCPFDSDHDSTVIKTGPITANAADAAIAMAIMAPNAPNHRFSKWYDGGINGPPKAHIGRFNDIEDLSDVRIGIYPEYFNDSQPYIRDRGYKVVDYLKSRGATIVEIKIPHLQSMSMAHGTKIASEFALGFDRGFHDNNSP
jgi:Asp-tRNA(Asn)/Glu-tRNA(Gln) amidotransferase A subunit family amidase